MARRAGAFGRHARLPSRRRACKQPPVLGEERLELSAHVGHLLGGADGGASEGVPSRRLAREHAGHGARAGIRVEARVALGARVVGELGGAAAIGDDDRQAAAHRFRDAQPERLVRARVDQRVGAGQRAGELGSIAHEPLEAHVVSPRDARLHALPLRPVAEEDQHGVVRAPKRHEPIERHVPALLDGEAPHAHQQACVRMRRAEGPEQLAPSCLARARGRELAALHAEGHVHHARQSVRAELLHLPLRGHERRVAPARDGAHHRPERLQQDRRGRGREVPLQHHAEVGVDEVGVPAEGADPEPRARHRQRARRRDVGRVDLEHVGALAPDHVADFVHAPEQVVRRVVRKRRACNANHTRAPSARRSARGGFVFGRRLFRFVSRACRTTVLALLRALV